MSIFQLENFPYSIIPEKRTHYSAEKICIFHYSAPQNGIIPLFQLNNFRHSYSIILFHTPKLSFRIRNNSYFVSFFHTLLQEGDPNEDGVSELTLTGPDHELVVDTTLRPDDIPPEEIKKRAVKLIKELKGEDVKPEESVVSVELWDFAGQHLYYASHPVFLSSRALYILVCNLSKSLHDTAKPCVRQGSRNVDLENPNGETNLENLLSWLSTVHSVAQMRRETCDDVEEEVPHLRPPVIIVGTHADKPFENIEAMKTEIQNAIAGKDYEGHVVRSIFSIDNTAKLLQNKIRNVFRENENIDDIGALRVKIMEVLRQEPYIGEKIPVR